MNILRLHNLARTAWETGRTLRPLPQWADVESTDRARCIEKLKAALHKGQTEAQATYDAIRVPFKVSAWAGLDATARDDWTARLALETQRTAIEGIPA